MGVNLYGYASGAAGMPAALLLQHRPAYHQLIRIVWQKEKIHDK